MQHAHEHSSNRHDKAIWHMRHDAVIQVMGSPVVLAYHDGAWLLPHAQNHPGAGIIKGKRCE
jgi:hypothetical protein